MNKDRLPKEAAVVVLHELSSDSLILTQRSPSLHNHPGEICFPGGGWEKGDKNLYHTALRELQEELGILPSRVQLQRALAPECTLTGYIIHPWLASIDNLSPYTMDKSEVTEVFSFAMQEVMDVTNYQQIQLNRFGLHLISYQYTASSHRVWGATARIMMQLIGDGIKATK